MEGVQLAVGVLPIGFAFHGCFGVIQDVAADRLDVVLVGQIGFCDVRRQVGFQIDGCDPGGFSRAPGAVRESFAIIEDQIVVPEQAGARGNTEIFDGLFQVG